MKNGKTIALSLALIFILQIVASAYILAPIPTASADTGTAAQPTPALPKGMLPGVGLKDFHGKDQASWYKTVEGVLAVPGEMPLYPFEHGSTLGGTVNGEDGTTGDVKVGFSRFGELIDPITMSGDPRYPEGVGFAYTDRAGNTFDPIANAIVSINEHQVGWELVVTYKPSNSPTLQTTWAYAMFSDGDSTSGAGSPVNGLTGFSDCPNVADGWILCTQATIMPNSPTLNPHGGRKTNGYVVSSPSPVVLYEGPRRVILESQNTLYAISDPLHPNTNTPIASFTITLDFNKDSKEITLLKDVKLLLPAKEYTPVTGSQCQAYERTIGYGAPPVAGIFFAGGYTPNTALSTTNPRPSQSPGYACFELQDKEELDQATTSAGLFLGGNIQGFGHFYTLTNAPTTVKLLCDTLGNAEYHWDCRTGTTGTNNKYAVVETTDTTFEHVVKKAYWPHPDWWTPNAFQGNQITGSLCQIGCMFGKLDTVADTDTLPTVAGVDVNPVIVGTGAQWNFILDCSPKDIPACTPSLSPLLRGQWRSVETVGITDKHDGDVAVAGAGHTNVIDREFTYLDNMIFNPWDLAQAADKQYNRLVTYIPCQVTTGCPTVSSLTGTMPGLVATMALSGSGGNPAWDSYASFAERVLDVTNSGDEMLLRGGNDCTGGTAPTAAYVCGLTPAYRQYDLTGCNGLGTCTGITVRGTGYTFKDSQGVVHSNTMAPGTNFKVLWSQAPNDEKMEFFTPTLAGASVLHLRYTPIFNIKFIEGHVTGSGDPGTWVTPTGTVTCQTATGTTVSCTSAPSLPTTIVYVTVSSNACTSGTTTTTCDEFKVVYDTPRGNYEWLVVGRDARTPSDTMGAAYVSEAFDSLKNIDVIWAGLDMQSTSFPSIPFVLYKFGSDDARADYKDPTCPDSTSPASLGLCEPPRERLRDDFSSITAIDSSDIILVGGPISNAATEMFNDWSSAIYRPTTNDFWGPGLWDGIPTNSGHTGQSFGIQGYGIVSTYMDLDGTVYFAVYGGTGEDTYWTAFLLLHGGVGMPLPAPGSVSCTFESHGGLSPTTENPLLSGCDLVGMENENRGVTSWIIHIDYTVTTHTPGFTVVKRLDNFSEKLPEQDP